MRVVLDTNVLVSAIRSRRGASFHLLSLLDQSSFEIAVSVPLVLEYEDAMTRSLPATNLTRADLADIIDYVCSVAVLQPIFFLWRPFLQDPKDDMVAEAAIAAGCNGIVTFNTKDFAEVRRFDLHVWTPAEFLGVLRRTQ